MTFTLSFMLAFIIGPYNNKIRDYFDFKQLDITSCWGDNLGEILVTSKINVTS